MQNKLRLLKTNVYVSEKKISCTPNMKKDAPPWEFSGVQKADPPYINLNIKAVSPGELSRV